MQRRSENGYALLALIIAIAVLTIWLTSHVDTYVIDIRREKEEEFITRGNEIARAIARYNNAGRLAPLRPGPLPLKLEDLTKVTEINGVKQLFLRPYALVDPLEKEGKWRPVRAGDPLIAEYFQNWAAYNSQVIPQEYLFLAGGTSLQSPVESVESEEKTDNQNSAPTPQQQWNFSLDNDDEENRPIIGVVSYNKADAYRRLFGKDVTYDKWLFIYMPPVQRLVLNEPSKDTGDGQTKPPTEDDDEE